MELANIIKPRIDEASVVLDGTPTPEYIANALKVTRKFDLGDIDANGVRNLKAWIQSNLNVSPGKLVYRGILDKRIKTPYWIIDTTSLSTAQVVPLLEYVFAYRYDDPNQQG
jgi:hypothetical protein